MYCCGTLTSRSPNNPTHSPLLSPPEAWGWGFFSFVPFPITSSTRTNSPDREKGTPAALRGASLSFGFSPLFMLWSEGSKEDALGADMVRRHGWQLPAHTFQVVIFFFSFFFFGCGGWGGGGGGDYLCVGSPFGPWWLQSGKSWNLLYFSF